MGSTGFLPAAAGGYGPYFDGRYTHNPTTNPGLNGLFEAVNQYEDTLVIDQQVWAQGGIPGVSGPPGAGNEGFSAGGFGFAGPGFNPATDPGLQYAASLQPVLSQASQLAHMG